MGWLLHGLTLMWGRGVILMVKLLGASSQSNKAEDLSIYPFDSFIALLLDYIKLKHRRQFNKFNMSDLVLTVNNQIGKTLIEGS